MFWVMFVKYFFGSRGIIFSFLRWVEGGCRWGSFGGFITPLSKVVFPNARLSRGVTEDWSCYAECKY